MNSYAQLKVAQQSRAVANTHLQNDQGPIATSQLNPLGELQERANLSPEVRHVAQMKQMLNGSSHASAPSRSKENQTGMPDRLKTGIERLSNLSLDDVKVRYNSSKPSQFQAHAITQGKDIHVGPGQEHHLPHEAWHLVQQKQGRVRATTQMRGTAINTDSTLEREADVMGARASQLTEGSLGLASASVNRPSLSGNSSPQPVGQLQPWKMLLGRGAGLYASFMMYNQLRQMHATRYPDRYESEVGRLGAFQETQKGPPGTAAYAMHLPISWFHLFAGNVGSSNIGEHYKKDIPHLVHGPDTDENLEAIAKTETHDFWNRQTRFLPYLMGRAVTEQDRARILKWSRDRRKTIE